MIATPTAVLAGDGAAGVFTSRNRGASWRPGRGLTATSVSSLTATGETPSRIYAETRPAGVYTTVNGGTQWTALGPATPGFYLEIPAVAVAPSDPRSIYLTTATGFYRRLEGAQHWTQLPWNSCVGPVRLAVDPADPATLVLSGIFTGIGCSRAPGACLLFKTTDAGTSWSCIDAGLPSGDHWSLIAPGILPASLAFSPVQAGLLYAALPNGVFRSTDSGATWQPLSTGLGDALISSLMVNRSDLSNPSDLYLGTFGNGVMRLEQ